MGPMGTMARMGPMGLIGSMGHGAGARSQWHGPGPGLGPVAGGVKLFVQKKIKKNSFLLVDLGFPWGLGFIESNPYPIQSHPIQSNPVQSNPV